MRGHEATTEAFVRMADCAEHLAFDALWCSAHIIVPPQVKSDYVLVPGLKYPPHWREQYWEPFTVLSFLAARTTHVRLGTSVTVLPMHNPFEIAKQVAEVDQLSGGRFTFGVGVGWFEEEFEILGQDYHTRGARTDDALSLMQALWTEEPVTYAGRFFSCEDASFAPKPRQRPYPPIWIGGNSEAAYRRVARFADAWHPARIPVADLTKARTRIGELLSERGREPDSIDIAVKTPLLITSSPPATPLAATHGTAQSIADAIKRYADAGTTEFVFDVSPETLDNAVDTMERFAQEVRPLLDDLPGN